MTDAPEARAMPNDDNLPLLQALAAVRRAEGNVSLAARTIGISRETLRGRYTKALRLGLDLHLDEARGASEETPAAGGPDLQAKYLQVCRERDEALRLLEESRQPAAQVEFPAIRTSKTRCRTRLIFPDLHGNHHDPEAVGALLADVEQVRPDEAIGLGDLLECGGWLAQHHTLGYVAEVGQMSYEHDVAAANAFLDRLQALVPKVELLEGNHEARIEKWCVTSTLRHGGDAEYLRRLIGPEFVLNLEARGIPYWKFHETHDGLEVPGVIRRGLLHLTHGFSTAKHAAWQHVLAAGGNVAYGHTHRADYAVNRTIAHGLAAAWCPGTLSRKQPLWQHNRPTTWTHGYLLQIISPDGWFQMLQVPIDKGRSGLSSVMESVIPRG